MNPDSLTSIYIIKDDLDRVLNVDIDYGSLKLSTPDNKTFIIEDESFYWDAVDVAIDHKRLIHNFLVDHGYDADKMLDKLLSVLSTYMDNVVDRMI